MSPLSQCQLIALWVFRPPRKESLRHELRALDQIVVLVISILGLPAVHHLTLVFKSAALVHSFSGGNAVMCISTHSLDLEVNGYTVPSLVRAFFPLTLR